MPFNVTTEPARSTWRALGHGLACKCPRCGEGALFRAYLKTNDTCPLCGEALFHHRADDMPPYLTILIVGHVLVGLMLYLEMVWHVPPIIYLMWLVPLAIVLPLAILPSIKGAVIGLQWANHMHGFGSDPDDGQIGDDHPEL